MAAVAERAMLTRVPPDGALVLRVVTWSGQEMDFMLTTGSLRLLQATVGEPGLASDAEAAGRLAALYNDLGASNGAEVLDRLSKLTSEARDTMVGLLKGGV